MRTLRICILITIVAIFGLGGHMEAHKKPHAFGPGERLRFTLRWERIPAGEAVLEVLPVETLKGIQSYHFVMTARSNEVIDKFYKVRDRIDAYTDVEMNRSILYKNDRNEGREKKRITVDFDWESCEAEYSNFGKKRDPIPVFPGSFDPLSVVYYVRLIDLNEKAQISVPVSDGKKSILLQVHVLRRETLELPGGTFDTYLLEPETRDFDGVFKKSKNAKLQVWITADEKRIPVKIKSKVSIGSFVGELMSLEGS